MKVRNSLEISQQQEQVHSFYMKLFQGDLDQSKKRTQEELSIQQSHRERVKMSIDELKGENLKLKRLLKYTIELIQEKK